MYHFKKIMINRLAGLEKENFGKIGECLWKEKNRYSFNSSGYQYKSKYFSIAAEDGESLRENIRPDTPKGSVKSDCDENAN